MPIDINFGALQQANPFAAYAQGQELGEQNRQRQARQAAGNVFATDPERASQILLSGGDLQGGMALRKYATEASQAKARAAALQRAAGGDVAGAQTDALNAGDTETWKALGEMSKEQRDKLRQQSEDLGAYANTLLTQIQSGKMSPQDAKAHILQDKSALLQLGLNEQEIDGFDPTPQNLQMLVSKGMDLKTALERGDKDRTFGLQQQQFGETKRHNRTAEATSQGQLGVARGNLGVRQQEFQARKSAGGFGTPGMGKVLGSELDPKDGW